MLWMSKAAADPLLTRKCNKSVIDESSSRCYRTGGRSGPTQGDEMLNWFQALMPKENRFFDLFARHADTLVGGAEVMSRMFAERQGIGDACRQISDYETQADNVTRDVLHAVRRTFITPF